MENEILSYGDYMKEFPYKFGDEIVITHKLVRILRKKDRNNKYSNNKEPVELKVWEKCEMSKICIFLGFRTLQNGRRVWDSEYGYCFYPEEYFKAALVSPGPTENPIYVPLDAIQMR